MINEKCLLKMKKMLTPKKQVYKLNSKAKNVTSQQCRKISQKKKRTRVEDLYNNNEAKLSVMERAEEVLDSLADDFPSFVKCMLPSNVSHGFWLYLPMKFCREYLPMNDSTINLVGECGKEFEANYLVDRHGLSGGWRAFSLSQRILKGDVVIFQLVKPCTLKVHVVRVYGLDEVDAALCLMNLNSHKKRTTYGKKMRTKRSSLNNVKPLVNTIEYNLAESSFKDDPVAAKTERDSLGSEVLEGSEISIEFSKRPFASSHPRKSCSSFEVHTIISSQALQVTK